MNLDQMITVEAASQKYHLPIDVLTSFIQSGSIEAKEFDGMILVNDDGVRAMAINDRHQFSNLSGQPITLTEAAKKYEISRNTIWDWVNRGLINVIRPGYKMQLDEQDVAYCAHVYKQRGGSQGMRVFNPDGTPYELAVPDMAAYRREYRRRKKLDS